MAFIGSNKWIGVASTVPLLAAAVWGQATQPSETPRPAPVQTVATRISAYAGGYAWSWSDVSGGPARSPMLFAAEGAAIDLTWNIAGQQADASVSYRSAYDRNQTLPELNGFDHALSLHLRFHPDRRTTVGIDATGESTLVANALFEPAGTLTVAQQSTSANALATGLTNDPAADLVSSPLALVLSGGRQTIGAVHFLVTHMHSPRLQSQLRIGAVRDYRSSPQTPEFAAVYPSSTAGMAEATIRYAASRRSYLTWSADYWRSYSAAERFSVESATMGWERLLGRRSFGRIEGGYARTSFFGTDRAARNGYVSSAAIGTAVGNHTLVASVHRGVADLHGLGVGNTISAGGAWSWARLRSPFALAAGVDYERVAGVPTTLGTWLYHATATQRLANHLSLQLDAAYANQTTTNVMDFARRGARLSVIWSSGDVSARRP